MSERKKTEQVLLENDLSELLAAWRDDFRIVVSEFEVARGRIKDFEQAELRESNQDLEIDQLQTELATCRERIKRLTLQTTAAKSLEASGKLKDRKISFLEQEKLEVSRSHSVTIEDLRNNLSEKVKRIGQLETSIHRHEETLAKFQEHLKNLRRMYSESKSADKSDNEKTQLIEEGLCPEAGASRSDLPSLDEFQVMGAEEYLKTQVINMREPLLKARVSGAK